MKCYIRYSEYPYEGQGIHAVFATLQEAMEWRRPNGELDIDERIMLIIADEELGRWKVAPVTHEWVESLDP